MNNHTQASFRRWRALRAANDILRVDFDSKLADAKTQDAKTAFPVEQVELLLRQIMHFW
jgi:hypothetical protein